MQDIKLNPDFSGRVRTLRQSPEAAQPSPADRQMTLARPVEDEAVRPAAKLMLLVEKLTGAMLSGTAVTMLVGNLLICVFMLMLGPGFIIELLAKLNGLSA
jgi:hypothetical protein